MILPGLSLWFQGDVTERHDFFVCRIEFGLLYYPADRTDRGLCVSAAEISAAAERFRFRGRNLGKPYYKGFSCIKRFSDGLECVATAPTGTWFNQVPDGAAYHVFILPAALILSDYS